MVFTHFVNIIFIVTNSKRSLQPKLLIAALFIYFLHILRHVPMIIFCATLAVLYENSNDMTGVLL